MNIAIADFRQEAIDEALPVFKATAGRHMESGSTSPTASPIVKAADEAEAVFGKLHIPVNNAGIGIMEGKIWEASYEDMDFAIDINYKSILYGIKTIVPRILEHGEGGHIVSTSSKNGLIPCREWCCIIRRNALLWQSWKRWPTDLQGTGVGASVFCPGPYRTT